MRASMAEPLLSLSPRSLPARGRAKLRPNLYNVIGAVQINMPLRLLCIAGLHEDRDPRQQGGFITKA